MSKQLATITILTTDRQASSAAMNQLLTDYGHQILARLGVNVQKACVEHCTGLITIVLEATKEEITELADKLNAIPEIKAEACIMTAEL